MGLTSYGTLPSDALNLPVRIIQTVSIQKAQRMLWTFSSDAFGCPTTLLGTPVPVPLNCLYQRRVDGPNGASNLFATNCSIHSSFSGGFMENEPISHSDTDTHAQTRTHVHRHRHTHTHTWKKLSFKRR
jgi:hypothetical protein